MRIVGLTFGDYTDILTALRSYTKNVQNPYWKEADKLLRAYDSVQIPKYSRNVEICIDATQLRVLEHVLRHYQVEHDPMFKYLADHFKYLLQLNTFSA